MVSSRAQTYIRNKVWVHPFTRSFLMTFQIYAPRPCILKRTVPKHQLTLTKYNYTSWHSSVTIVIHQANYLSGRLRLNCDGTRAETRFRLSAKRTSPFKSAGASVQSTIGRRAVRISLQGLYCSCKPVFCSHVTLTGYPLHSLVSP
jgi:hypothetical protein